MRSLLLCAPVALTCSLEASFENVSLSELEQQQREIEQRLKVLARYSPRTGVGAIGCRTMIRKEPDHAEWMQIDLEDASDLDLIVLVPVLLREPAGGFFADSFPTEFRIRVGGEGDTRGRVVAEFDGSEGILPRVAPLIIPVDEKAVAWMRLEVERVPQWKRTGDYLLQLSEVFLFRGPINVALRQSVSLSHVGPGVNAWKQEFLTDGAVPYLMQVPRLSGTVAATSALVNDSAPPFELVMDLEADYSVSELQLHAVEQGDTAPQSYAGDFGLPNRFRLQGSDQPDFAESVPLLEVEFASIYEKSPMMGWIFPAQTCRYLRLIIDEPYQVREMASLGNRVGFAEICIFANGVNVSAGKIVTGNFSLSNDEQKFSRYTDGLNLYGEILPLREWLGELAERHRLEAQAPLIRAELSRRYAIQKRYLRLAVWGVIALAVAMLGLSIYGKVLRIRQEARVRERIAANLHDELGANLHAIGLLGDMARKMSKSPEGLDETLSRIRGLTERTGTAARHCANMMEADEICEDLEAEMNRDTSRLLGDLEHQFELIGAEYLKSLKRRVRIDLMLFYRECLINIIRHSGATRAVTRLQVDGKKLELTVDDNGKGYSGEISKALKRRALFMGASVSMQKSELGGVKIILYRKNRKFTFL